MSPPLALELPPELLEHLAERAAGIVAERLEPESEPWIGVVEAAEHLDCPRSRVYALASASRIPLERDGSRLLFKRSQLDEWVRGGGAKRP
ncbi:MAG: excisionase family DNA-binding protein [Thermoleophilaceae bacterium]